MQRGAQGGRFAFVGRRGALDVSTHGGAALALRNLNKNVAATATYSTAAKGPSKAERDGFDWSKFRTTSSKHDPYHEFISTEPRFGLKDVWTLGMDPPQPIFPVDARGHSKAYLPEILSRKHYYSKYAMLNRPQQLNAINLATVRQLTPVLKKWQAHKETTRAIMLTSTTDTFSSGIDFIDLLQAVRAGNQEYPRTYFRELYQLIYYINSLDKPFLPIMNGITMGAGAALGYNSNSFKIVTEDTVFALPEAGMGFFPDAGASHHLSRLPDHVGTFLALTSKRIRGWDVLWSGIATNLVPVERIHLMYDHLDEMRDQFHSFEQIIYGVHAHEADKIEHPYLLKEKGYLDIIKRCFSHPTVPEIMKALSHEKHPWAKQVLQRMKEQCPLSLAVTLRAMQEGAKKSLGQVLQQDYRIALRFMLTRDFAEGVTARIVERRTPEWSHQSVEAVHPDEVQLFFESLNADELKIKSLHEERAEESQVQKLIDEERRFKKMLRRPWIQEQAKAFVAKELKQVQAQLKAKRDASDALSPEMAQEQREAYRAKVHQNTDRKEEALRFLELLEAELVLRRDSEKAQVTRTTVDKLEWTRWEDDIRSVREAKGILSLEVGTENDEQLPTAALQTVLVEQLSRTFGGVQGDDLAQQVRLVAASLDTAGKSAEELKELLSPRPEYQDVDEQLKDVTPEAAFRATIRDAFEQIDPREIGQSLSEELGLTRQQNEQLEGLLSGITHKREHARPPQSDDEDQQPGQEGMPELKSALSLDDVARLVLGGDPDAAQVAATRAQIEKGEVQVSEETYAKAVELMRERTLATVAPEERALVEATFAAMGPELTAVVRAKVAGKSRQELAKTLFEGEGRHKLAQLLSDDDAAGANPYRKEAALDALRDFAVNIDSHLVNGKLPLRKIEEQLRDAAAQRELQAAWPKEKRDQFRKKISNDQQLSDLQALEILLGNKPHETPSAQNDDDDDDDDDVDYKDEGDDDDDDEDDDDDGEDESAQKRKLRKYFEAAQYEAAHGRPAPVAMPLATEEEKEAFERMQQDAGMAPYGLQFEYQNLTDRVAHFKRIQSRLEEGLKDVPDPLSEPEAHRKWLMSLRLAELVVPEMEEALASFFETRSRLGLGAAPLPEELKDLELKQKPGAYHLWRMAQKDSSLFGADKPARPTESNSAADVLDEIRKKIKTSPPSQ